MSESKTILVVVAHPDDELLGCAGTLSRHVKSKDRVFILILGDGEISRDDNVDVHKRADLARQAAKQIGASRLTLKTFSDNQFDTHSLLSIVKEIEKEIAEVQPHTIYTHHAYDLNIDHQLTFQAVMIAARPLPNTPVKCILTFETVSATEWQKPAAQYVFAPQRYINISKCIEEKIKLLEIYDDEMRPFPHPRSYEGIRVLAQKRGMEAGYEYAEAFEVVRDLHDE